MNAFLRNKPRPSLCNVAIRLILQFFIFKILRIKN